MPQIGTNLGDPEGYFNNIDPVIYGLDGDDFIRFNGAGPTYIEGGGGSDTITGNTQIDRIYGGEATTLSAAEAAPTVSMGAKAATSFMSAARTFSAVR